MWCGGSSYAECNNNNKMQRQYNVANNIYTRDKSNYDDVVLLNTALVSLIINGDLAVVMQ